MIKKISCQPTKTLGLIRIHARAENKNSSKIPYNVTRQ